MVESNECFDGINMMWIFDRYAMRLMFWSCLILYILSLGAYLPHSYLSGKSFLSWCFQFSFFHFHVFIQTLADYKPIITESFPLWCRGGVHCYRIITLWCDLTENVPPMTKKIGCLTFFVYCKQFLPLQWSDTDYIPTWGEAFLLRRLITPS